MTSTTVLAVDCPKDMSTVSVYNETSLDVYADFKLKSKLNQM